MELEPIKVLCCIKVYLHLERFAYFIISMEEGTYIVESQIFAEINLSTILHY